MIIKRVGSQKDGYARFVPKEAKIITAKVPVDKILLYKNDRGEEEVVIIPLSPKDCKSENNPFCFIIRNNIYISI